MKHTLLLLALLNAALLLRAQPVLNITAFGAVGNGSTMNTTAIQAAIDSAHALGGATVLVPAGTFRSNTLILKSFVTLRLEAGAELQAPTNISEYPEIPYDTATWSDTYTQRSLLFAENAHHIRLTGQGTINGNGFNPLHLSTPKNLRPFVLRFHRCQNVEVDSLRFESSPHWMLHFKDLDSLYIHDLNIYNHGYGSNDGINVDGCREVLIENCSIDSNDDPIAIKTHSEYICRNVEVRACTLATFERGVKVGNESCGGFENIWFHDIHLTASAFPIPLPAQTAIYCAVADGGYVDGVVFERITSDVAYDTPIFIRLCNRGNICTPGNPPPPVQYLRNVVVRDCQLIAGTTIPSSITGIPGFDVENIVLENLDIRLPGGADPMPATPNLSEKETLRPENDIWGDSLPAHGVFVRHAVNLELLNICHTLDEPDPRPEYVMFDTANVNLLPPAACASARNGHLQGEVWQVYPNPARTQLQLRHPLAGQVHELWAVGSQGSRWMLPVHRLGSGQLQADVQALPNGLYVLFHPVHGALGRFVRL